MGDEQTTESEDRKEKDAAEAAERIKRGQHWLDWMYIAEGLEVGRVKAMRRAGTNRPIGSAYNRAFGDWLNERSWARDLDKPTRNHLFWCADNRNNIEAWRETLGPNERARLNHPTALKRRYEATHNPDEANAGGGRASRRRGRRSWSARSSDSLTRTMTSNARSGARKTTAPCSTCATTVWPTSPALSRTRWPPAGSSLCNRSSPRRSSERGRNRRTQADHDRHRESRWPPTDVTASTLPDGAGRRLFESYRDWSTR